ncbi:MAG: RecQ family ATP-dependent DNA helicase [Bacteroidetes bacterium]|nr:RecQ family ATP-dependent DNA helicase [Bacteroidota bacterium]
MTIQQILTKYWGHSSFRPLQEDIINSVLSGNDTLALLPTGGGKSICFQVPALVMPGICIVVSPLIALMKDQVENLKIKGIKAIGIYSGMHKNEIDIAIDNCVYGDIKFLYLSPERLETDIIKTRIKKMKVNLIAVDEAHCISQWGYDFRPPYLKIGDFRELLPNVPVLALTATATPPVISDIQDRLLFKKENVFKKSYERTNLTYAVLKEEDKDNRLLKLLENVKGCGIIYVRNRKKTKDIASFLIKNGVSADFYHAGLEPKVRDDKQSAWIKGQKRIMVSTNAFGMGIDKSNVRLVVHVDLPDNIEAYFQEAGRAGRDENQAFAILLYNDADIIDLKHSFENSFPEPQEIKNVYHALGNYFQLAVGSGKDNSFDFDIIKFSNNYNFKPVSVYSCLKFLEKQGYIFATEALYNPTQIFFLMKKEDLYSFQVSHSRFDGFIKILLRSYSGLLTEFVKINESEIAMRSNLTIEAVTQFLEKLQNFGVIAYKPQKKLPQIIYSIERLDSKEISISPEHYAFLKDNALARMNSVIKYATSSNKCRSQILLGYFGEKNPFRCGKCDVCKERNKMELNEIEFDAVVEQIKPILAKTPMNFDQVVSAVKGIPEKRTIKVIQWLLDNDKLYYDDTEMLNWKK